MPPSPSRVAARYLAAASKWSPPAFEDPGMSESVVTRYLPADDLDSGEVVYEVKWYGDPKGPDPTEHDAYFVSLLDKDFNTLAAAQKAVEREFKKRN